MDNLLEILSMSGYAAYVWSAVFMAVFMLIANVWSAKRALRMVRQKIRAREKR